MNHGNIWKTKGKPSWDVYIYITCGWSFDETTYSSWLINRSEIEKPTTKRKKHGLVWFSREWNHINGSPSIGVFFLWTGDGIQNKTRIVTPRQINYVQSLVVHKEYMSLLLIIICHSNKNANEFLPSPRRYPRSGMKETKSVTRPKPWMIVTHDHRHWISLHHLHNLSRLSQIPTRKKNGSAYSCVQKYSDMCSRKVEHSPSQLSPAHQKPWRAWTRRCPRNSWRNWSRWWSTWLSLDWFNQWEFQDPKMEVLYHIRPYFLGIFPLREKSTSNWLEYFFFPLQFTEAKSWARFRKV